jgi:hypothetical protein
VVGALPGHNDAVEEAITKRLAEASRSTGEAPVETREGACAPYSCCMTK